MNDAVTEVMDNAVADVTNAVGDAVPTDVTEKIGFVERYLNELPQKALNLGIRVVLALVFFLRWCAGDQTDPPYCQEVPETCKC